LKKPTLDAFYYADLAHAAQATVNQLEQWITRKFFTADRPTSRGSSRRFTLDDARRAAVMSYLVNRCGVPLAVGAHVAAMLHDQRHLFGDMHDLDIYVLVFPDAAAKVTMRNDQAVVDAITFAVSWNGPGGSVSWMLREKNPTGVTIANLSRIVKEADQRLAVHLDGLGDHGYDDTEE